MRRIKTLLILGLITAIGGLLSSCQPTPQQTCLECMGCFGNYTICEESFVPDMAYYTTWDEYVQFMTRPENSSQACQLKP